MSLEPNQEVKNPHPPFDTKFRSNVAAEDGVNGGGQIQNLARRGEHFNELLGVPRVNETQINIHRPIDFALINWEKFLRFSGVIKDHVKTISGQLSAEHSQKHAAAEDWIDESRSITGQQPAIAKKLRISIRKIRCDGHW